MKEISIVAGHVKRYGYISWLARPELVTIIFRSLCLPEIGQLFLPTNQTHNALMAQIWKGVPIAGPMRMNPIWGRNPFGVHS